MVSVSRAEQLALPLNEGLRVPLFSRKYPGLFALVDAEDYERVAPYRWYPLGDGVSFYAVTKIGGKQTYMHRCLMNPPTGYVVDHRNLNKLDNRRSVNLRVATPRQNNANSLCRSRTGSPYKGVRFHPVIKRWLAQSVVGGTNTHLGLFDTAEEAARAYDMMAREVFGEFARCNFPD